MLQKFETATQKFGDFLPPLFLGGSIQSAVFISVRPFKNNCTLSFNMWRIICFDDIKNCNGILNDALNNNNKI